MHPAVAYLSHAICQAGMQLLTLFGWILLLALALRIASGWIRGLGGGTLGKVYYWCVAPGVISHECGHALGCLITHTKIMKFVPFAPKGDTLGYVTHQDRRGLLGSVAELIIATGPIWFGCIVITAALKLFTFLGFTQVMHTAPKHPITIEYAKELFFNSAQLFLGCCTPWNWSSAWYLLGFYVLFCIASEMSLSPSDLKGCVRGILVIIMTFFCLNLIPGATGWIEAGTHALIPRLFNLHILMGFGFMLTLAVYLVAGLPITLIRRNK